MFSTGMPHRIMIAKLGLDGHDRGARVVARVLRDAGMDVIYTGLHKTPDEVVTAAIQEDVDVLGISLLSGAHMTLMPRVMTLLKTTALEDIPVVLGGVFPEEDVPQLLHLGISEVLGQDTPPDSIVRSVRRLAAMRRSRAASE
jgi:methylmalonyl-CoA mutase C-terminal domain/subunit